MVDNRSTRSKLVLFAFAIIVTCSVMTLRAAPPAPTLNAPVVSGLSVNLSWSNVGATQYFVQAGLAPGQTLVEFPVGAATSLPAAGPAGTYFVRVVGADATGRGPASNEVVVTLGAGGGCTVPTAPFNLRAIVRGAEAFIFWRGSATGGVTGYTLQVGGAPGQTFQQFPVGGTTVNATQSSGSFFLRVVANSACGASTPSNEIQVSFPGNTGRVADPDPGTVLGMPDVAALVSRLFSQNAGSLNQSCPNGRKYENNPWQDKMVDGLRQYDTRFGYNAKPTRTAADNNGFPVTAAGDEMTFFAGAGNAQGSPNVYAFDILFNHCGDTPGPEFRNISPEPAIWTGAGRFPGQ
jgi:hypothetical protein